MGLENGDGGRPSGNGEWLWDAGREAGRRQLRSWLRDSPGAEQSPYTRLPGCDTGSDRAEAHALHAPWEQDCPQERGMLRANARGWGSWEGEQHQPHVLPVLFLEGE